MTAVNAPRRHSRGPYAQGRVSRELILETALDVITRKGYSATSLRDIASEVGMTQAGLLHHFGTRENLFTELLSERDKVSRRALANVAGDEPMIIRVARHNELHPGLVHLYVRLQAAAGEPGHPAHQFFRQRDIEIRERIAADIRERQAAGTFDKEANPAESARILIALSDGLQAEWAIDSEIEIAVTLERLWSAFAGGVLRA